MPIDNDSKYYKIGNKNKVKNNKNNSRIFHVTKLASGISRQRTHRSQKPLPEICAAKKYICCMLSFCATILKCTLTYYDATTIYIMLVLYQQLTSTKCLIKRQGKGIYGKKKKLD